MTYDKATVMRDPETGVIYVRLHDHRDSPKAGEYGAYQSVAVDLPHVAWDTDLMRDLTARVIAEAGHAVSGRISVPPRYVLKLWTASPVLASLTR